MALAPRPIGGIVGVALEVAPQPAVLSRDGQAVARKSKMIEPDADVACIQQGLRDRFRLQVPVDTIGQGVFGDLALMLLERGNVGVAEHRKAVRPEFDAFGDGVETGVYRLQRKPVEQVEIDLADTGPVQTFDSGRNPIWGCDIPRTFSQGSSFLARPP